jgi:hypothetical protein
VAFITALTIVATSLTQSAEPSLTMRVGGVYCVSQSAIEEHLKATSDADVDKVRDILQVRRICDYAQAPVRVSVLESPSRTWAKVRLSTSDGPWRKGSKMVLPKDLIVYVRRSSLQ